MKQRKEAALPTQPASPKSTREELDTCLKHIISIVEKNPKKVAQVFKGWLDEPTKSSKGKKAA